MVNRLLPTLFVILALAVLYRVLVPPPLPFEIYPAPRTILLKIFVSRADWQSIRLQRRSIS